MREERGEGKDNPHGIEPINVPKRIRERMDGGMSREDATLLTMDELGERLNQAIEEINNLTQREEEQ